MTRVWDHSWITFANSSITSSKSQFLNASSGMPSERKVLPPFNYFMDLVYFSLVTEPSSIIKLFRIGSMYSFEDLSTIGFIPNRFLKWTYHLFVQSSSFTLIMPFFDDFLPVILFIRIQKSLDLKLVIFQTLPLQHNRKNIAAFSCSLAFQSCLHHWDFQKKLWQTHSHFS